MVEQRTSLGLSQRELAAMCGIPQSSVARIESFKTTPNLGTLLNIFQHLGLQLYSKTYKTYNLKSRKLPYLHASSTYPSNTTLLITVPSSLPLI